MEIVTLENVLRAAFILKPVSQPTAVVRNALTNGKKSNQ